MKQRETEEQVSHDPFHPRHLDRAVWNTNGYMHEDEPATPVMFGLVWSLAGAACAGFWWLMVVIFG